jgi:dipeptidyl-peptidase 4
MLLPQRTGWRCWGVVFLLTLPAWGQGSKADYERAASLPQRTENKVFRSQVRPKWLPGGTRFWYKVQTGPETSEWVVVDAEQGTRTVTNSAPEAEVVVAGKALGAGPRRSRRTGDESQLTFVNQTAGDVELFWLDEGGERKSYGRVRPGSERSQHTFAGHVWLVTDTVGTPLSVFEATDTPGRAVVGGAAPTGPAPVEKPKREPGESPDGNWVAFMKDSNVFLRAKPGGEAQQLTQDGVPGDAYAPDVSWAPDSTVFVARKVRSGGDRKVSFVEAAPLDQLQPKLHTHDYLKPGDPLPKPVFSVFSVADRKQRRVEDTLYSNPYTEDGDLDLRWAPDSREFYLAYNQRGHQVYRILAVDPKPQDPAAATLRPRVVVEETSPTFIDWTNKTWRRWLESSPELIWMSERDGWAHLWLYDVATGTVKNQITRGNWVVRNVLHVDEAKRELWFLASGVRPDQDPYFLHLCRVKFDGTGFQILTEGNGHHRAEFSPDRRWFVDTWSRVDQAPVTELRRSSDGARVLELERADATALLAAGWTVPEPFVAKGRDGVTDIYGVIIKPSNFDPTKSYPVLEEIYAGPQGAFVPKEFGRLNRHHSLAELGFVVVQVDGMGTNHRGKKFHDVCWKDLADSGLPDHIAWLKAAAVTRPWMDLTRVGIYGGSAGGQSSTRALLAHPEFYKVAVSDCGCHDNRMDKLWWNEQWLGWPVDDSYRRSSNVEDAGKLKGKLLLTVGELDTNVDPASTLQVAAALVRADKEFELLIVPSANHGAGESPYASRRRMDFFVRHLLGREPRWE